MEYKSLWRMETFNCSRVGPGADHSLFPFAGRKASIARQRHLVRAETGSYDSFSARLMFIV